MLSHYNVISNIDAMAQLFWLGEHDRIVGVLPFFHSFGFTVTIWFPLVAGCGVVYHPNPTDAKAIGETDREISRHVPAVPRRPSAPPIRANARGKSFASLRFVLAGAEKLREPVAAAFREKFGVELLEGYGCDGDVAGGGRERAQLSRPGKDSQIGNKPGTVGHPLPGVAAQVVDPATLRAARARASRDCCW